MKRANLLRAATLLLVLSSVRAPAQTPDYLKKVKALQQAMKGDSTIARVEAVEAFQDCGDAAGVKILIGHLNGNEKELAKVRSRFEKVGKKLHAERAKITNARVTRAQMAAVQAKIRPLEDEHRKLDDRIVGLERVSTALARGVGNLVKSVPSDRRQRAIQEVVQAYEWASKPEGKALALRTMAWVDDPMVITTVKGAARLARNPGVRVAAFETMAKLARPEMAEVALDALTDKFWQVRVAAIGVIKKVGGKESIDPLIVALEHAEGRMIDEIVGALKTLTKVNHHDNVALWRDWWRRSKDRFEGRGADAGVPGEVARGGGEKEERGAGGGTYFYGIQTRSKHVIYVLDISGSMRWTLQTRYREGRGGLPPDAPAGKSKLDNAVKELLQSIAGLPENGTFNIITYAIEHDIWKKKMQKASKSAKAASRKWAKALEADGATNIFDALERAFKLVGRGSFDAGYGLAADTIFFLSDGQANRGRVVEAEAMLREIRKLNDLKKVQIHCVGLGSSTDERFMRRLAEENNGQYVHIAPGR